MSLRKQRVADNIEKREDFKKKMRNHYKNEFKNVRKLLKYLDYHRHDPDA